MPFRMAVFVGSNIELACGASVYEASFLSVTVKGMLVRGGEVFKEGLHVRI